MNIWLIFVLFVHIFRIFCSNLHQFGELSKLLTIVFLVLRLKIEQVICSIRVFRVFN